jgi:hypothetical protein
MPSRYHSRVVSRCNGASSAAPEFGSSNDLFDGHHATVSGAPIRAIDVVTWGADGAQLYDAPGYIFPRQPLRSETGLYP